VTSTDTAGTRGLPVDRRFVQGDLLVWPANSTGAVSIVAGLVIMVAGHGRNWFISMIGPLQFERVDSH
jgi:hypothetical protein